MKIGTQIGTKSNRLERTERTQIGVSTKAHCMTTVLGLRTIGTEIGGMTIAMIGLRIGHGMMNRSGSPLIGSPRFSRRHCHRHFNRLASQASSAAKAAPIASQAQPQTAAAVIASPPGLANPSNIADESLIASSSSG